MEDFLQLIVKCFPMATFILVAASCTSKPKEPIRSSPRKLTISTSSISSEDVSKTENMEKSEEEEEKEEKLETDLPEEMKIDEERSVACGNKKDPKEKTDEEKKKEENKGEQDVVLDELNPHIVFFMNNESRDIPQTIFHAKHCLEQIAVFQWTMKKRMSFDEGCWKQLSRRISAIKAEGLDSRPNTRKAKENKQSADRETKLDVIFAKWSVGKPKKKGGE